MEAQSKSRMASKQKELSRDLAAANLDAALEAQDAESFMKQLSEVIKAGGGYSAAARAAGLNRTALYKIASPEGNPALSTLVSLLTPLGLRLSIKTIRDPSPKTELESTDVFKSYPTGDVYAQNASENDAPPK